jgi:hypothetical protein
LKPEYLGGKAAQLRVEKTTGKKRSTREWLIDIRSIYDEREEEELLY